MDKIINKNIDLALLIIRVGMGITFMIHGYPKITGGVEKWKGIGGAMSNFGLNFMPEFWGFMASFAEFFGGLFLILGIFFQPACALILMTMFVATFMHISNGDPLSKIIHPIENAIPILALFISGAGNLKLGSKNIDKTTDNKLSRDNDKVKL